MQCINCNSTNLKKLGVRFSGKTKSLGYVCKDCGESFTAPFHIENEVDNEVKSDNDDLHYIRSEEFIQNIISNKRIVFTTALNNTPINKQFFKSIQVYCAENNASLVVFPIRYKNPSLLSTVSDDSESNTWYAPEIEQYLVENNFDIIPRVKALGGLKTQATVENPLSGVDGLSKGNTIIFGHPQLALKTIPRNSDKYPAIATTTGAITEKNYSSTKAGYKAAFNHSMSAAIIEIDDDGDFFIRHLNFDGKGFYDLDYYYNSVSKTSTGKPIKALVTGDEHAVFADPEVRAATYDNVFSITACLNPTYIVRHDVMDFFSGSHHHKHNIFLKFAKHHSDGVWSVQNELNRTIEYINKTTPKNSTNIIIASNHNEHLLRWLNECDPKEDPENALLYHKLMYKMLEQTVIVDTDVRHPEPFELYASEFMTSNTKFLSRNEAFTIGEVEVANHGDKGVNGSRGTSKQFSNIPIKNITGHTHSPVIDKSNYTVGTSSKFKLAYVSGLSSWDHAHVIIQPNGKRQMIFIRNGKWRSL